MNLRIYVRTTEPWSQVLVQYLNAQHLPYSKVDVSADPGAFQEMVQKSGQKRVPVIDIDGQIVVGFDQLQLDELLSDATGVI